MKLLSVICLFLALPFSYAAAGQKITTDYLGRVLIENERQLRADILATFSPEEITELSIQVYKPVIAQLARCEAPSVGLRMIFESFFKMFGRSLYSVEHLQLMVMILCLSTQDPNYNSELDKLSQEFAHKQTV